MKIATFNINGISSRLPALLRWLEREQPDVACLQELKAADNRFPANALRDAGYHAIWQGQSAWTQPGPKFDFKLAWFERLIRHARGLCKSGHPVVLAGDFNVVPTDFDIYNRKSWRKDALLQPESRAAYARLLKQGWTDSIRKLHPDRQVFTFWDYFRNHWQRNAGLRIDHLLLNAQLAPALVDAGVDAWVRGEPKASDHAPVWIELKVPRPRARKKAVRR